MEKLYVQSRSQNLFYRVYMSATQIFSILITAGIITLFTDTPLTNLSFSLYAILGIAAIYTIWLMVFNSGKSKVIEHGIELSDKGVSYIHYGSKKTILWANYNGFSIKRKFPRLVLLLSSDNINIEFNYYAFSSEQRTEIFNYLGSK